MNVKNVVPVVLGKYLKKLMLASGRVKICKHKVGQQLYNRFYFVVVSLDLKVN